LLWCWCRLLLRYGGDTWFLYVVNQCRRWRLTSAPRKAVTVQAATISGDFTEIRVLPVSSRRRINDNGTDIDNTDLTSPASSHDGDGGGGGKKTKAMEMMPLRPSISSSSIRFPTLLNSRGTSTILTRSSLEQLLPTLPPILALRDMQLLYSSNDHGSSLATLYRLVDLGTSPCGGSEGGARADDMSVPTVTSLMMNADRQQNTTPNLLLVRDEHRYVMAIYSPQPFRRSSSSSSLYDGNAEVSVYQLQPTFAHYATTDVNEFYLLTTDKCLAAGGG
jgi:hypothetical protein